MSARRLPSRSGAAHGRNLGRFLFRFGYRLKIAGAENVPRRGRVIVAANHIGFLDGPLLFAACPRPLHLVAKSEVFKPPANLLLESMGQIEVAYDSPDRVAVRRTIAVLDDDQAVGIFPEAHRGLGTFARMRHGIAYLAALTGAPIIPTAIFGTRATGMGKDGLPPPRSRLDVVFGEGFSPVVPGDPRRRATLGRMGEEIRQRLADHVADAAAATGRTLPTDDTALATEADIAARRSR